MLKIIKKYNKWLLAIFGVMLILTFLVQGTAGQFQGDPGSQVVATRNGSKLTANDMREAEIGFKYLEETVPALVRGMGIENFHHWYLLSTEAERAGLVGDVEDGLTYRSKLAQDEAYIRGMAQYGELLRSNPQFRQFIEQQIQQGVTQMKPLIESRFDAEANRARLLSDEANRVLAKFRGVGRLLRAVNATHRLSDRATIAGFKRLADGAIVEAVVIPARPLVSTAPEPTDADLQAHFDRYRTFDPNARPDGIGYVLPRRISVEWMKVDKEAVRASIKPDPVQINKVYMQDQQLDAAKRQYPGELTAERTKIEAAIVEETLAKILADIDQIARGTLSFAVDKLPKDGAYRKLTADWSRPTFPALAQSIVDGVKTRENLTIPLPTADARESLLTPAEVGELPGIGRSFIRIGDARRAFSEAAFNLREFSPPASIGLQVGVPFIGVAATDAQDNRYYFVVTRAVESGPASTMAEVRERVIEDWKTLAAFGKLEADLQAEQLLAVSDGLEAVSKKFKTIAGTAAKPESFEIRKQIAIARVSEGGGDPLRSKAVVDAVLQLAASIDPLTPVTEVNPVLRTIAIPLPEQLTIVVVQIQALRPVTSDDLHLITDNDVRSLADRELQLVAKDAVRPYTFESMKKRLNYKPAFEEEQERKAAPADAPAKG